MNFAQHAVPVLSRLARAKQAVSPYNGAGAYQNTFPVVGAGQPFWYRRRFVHLMQMEPPDNLLDQVTDLWQYVACRWLTLRAPVDDSRRTRWPL
jgi:hypothetical protein